MSGDTTPSGETRERTSANAERSAGKTGVSVNVAAFSAGQGAKAGGIGFQEEVSPTIKAGSGLNDVPSIFVREQYLFENHSQDSRYKGPLDVCPMLPAQLGTGGNNTPFVCIPINDKATRYQGGGDTRKNDGAGNGLGGGKDGDPSPALTNGDRHGIAVLPFDTTQITSPQNGCKPKYGDPCHPLCAGAHPPAVVCEKEIQAYAEQRHGEYKKSNNFSTQTNRQYKSTTDLVYDGFVRRLTPLECERLQGFLDGWTDIGEWYDEKGKKHKPADSPRYKALGNSIALPPWRFVLSGIYKNLYNGATLGSLFDGIGGFPLIWKQLGGIPVWASEIEPFPIAVTKKRFGET